MIPLAIAITAAFGGLGFLGLRMRATEQAVLALVEQTRVANDLAQRQAMARRRAEREQTLPPHMEEALGGLGHYRGNASMPGAAG